jgi:PhnB protein
MRLDPYLTFNGQCAEAFKFYAAVLRGRIDALLTHGETPAREHVSPDWYDKIMHAHLTVGDMVLMGSDAPAQFYQTPQGFSVSVQLTDPNEAERIFNALAENGVVRMPLEETFWAKRFGMLVDRFGIPWMINCAPAA